MDYIIIGAGAAGLMAAKTLIAGGKKVLVLEAAQRIGGRIHTVQPAGFSEPVEAGAEFVHGQLPITLQLLKEADITYVPVSGNMWQVKEGKWTRKDEESEGWDAVMQHMAELKTDLTIADFLYQYFGEEKYASVRQRVQRFAEGFDLADIFTASTFALRDEWSSEEAEEYRLPAGYIQLVHHLEKTCLQQGCEILKGCRVHRIDFSTGMVTVTIADGRSFTAGKAIVTVPLGILQQDEHAANAIRFSPDIPEYLEAFRKMGYGGVVKIAMEFKQPFWESIANDITFILSEQPVPTWWTQLSLHNGLLTGWLAGPEANAHQFTNRQTIYDMAMQSLSGLFRKPVSELEQDLNGWEIFNWPADLFTAGAYSFSTVDTAAALRTVTKPIRNTLYFAGEAIYDGKHPGTVEAALESGKQVAEKILKAI